MQSAQEAVLIRTQDFDYTARAGGIKIFPGRETCFSKIRHNYSRHTLPQSLRFWNLFWLLTLGPLTVLLGLLSFQIVLTYAIGVLVSSFVLPPSVDQSILKRLIRTDHSTK